MLADAIIWAWYPGEQGGNAIADCIFGDVSPSGKLPITFVKSVDQLPEFSNYSMKGRTYRYSTQEPFYPFGFGLTYSKIEIGDQKTDKKIITEKENLKIEVSVKNTGSFNIQDVIQLYISHKGIKYDAPLREMKDFRRISLAAGETKNLTFIINPDMLKVVNLAGKNVWEKSEVTIEILNACPFQRSVDLVSANHVNLTINLK